MTILLSNFKNLKWGPANHKVFSTKEGSRIMEERRSDFEFRRLFKDSGSYIFIAENSKKPLAREVSISLISKFIKDYDSMYIES